MGLVWVFLVSGQMKLGHEKLYLNNGSPRSTISQKEISDSRATLQQNILCTQTEPNMSGVHTKVSNSTRSTVDNSVGLNMARGKDLGHQTMQ